MHKAQYNLDRKTASVSALPSGKLDKYENFLSQQCKIFIQVFIILRHCILCICVIHSDSVQKILIALFKLVWNTPKITWINIFVYQGKMFVNIETILVKISEEQP